MEIINICNLKKIYRKQNRTVYALNGINLNVNSGEFLSIMGASGSGKSTLMNILGCLDVQTSGEYSIFGKNTADLSKKEISDLRSRNIGFIFQNFNLIPSLNALENVCLPLMYRKMPKYERECIAKRALIAVGLEDRLYHYPSEMSGGQQQRTAVARAIASNPDIILADEPTGNLDATSSKSVMHILRKMNNDGKTVILITHDPKVALFADKIIKIDRGVIAK